MITSPKNSRIKGAQKLLHKRYRTSEKLLLLEGVRLINDALDSAVCPKLLFYAPDLIKKNSQAENLIARVEHMNIECVACTPAALVPLTKTVTPQGVVAVTALPEDRLAPHVSLLLILDQVREPGNAGTLLRSAEAAGVEQIIFAPNTVDPFNDKVLRGAMGAHFRLPISVCHTWEQLFLALDKINLGSQHAYLAKSGNQLSYESVSWCEPSILIIGGEADGASLEAQAWATSISIPMIGKTESLNAAVAGSIILFEAARQRRSCTNQVNPDNE
ncbi:MAG: RNA methyltransferase [Chloroflexota bacterium]